MLKELFRTFPSFPGSLAKGTDDGLTIAVVGCGYWGAKHVRVLVALTDVREVIVVEPRMLARNSILEAFPNIDVVPSLQSVLHRVHGVVIATPPCNHSEIALQALRAGKHVLIEKPVTTSLRDAQNLIREAALYDAVLMAGHTFEFNPVVRELRRRMDDGELGDIKFIHSARLNLGLYRSDVNVIWDLAPHDISIMNYLLRSTPTMVKAWGSAHVASNVIDVAHFELNYDELGVVGHGHVSWLDPRKVRQVTVVGTRKMAVYDDVADEKLRIYDRGVVNFDEGFAAGSKLNSVPLSYRFGDIISPQIQSDEPLKLEVQHFVDCIHQRTDLLSDGGNGAAVVAALEAIDQAVISGQSVKIEQYTESFEPLPRPLRN